MLWFFHWLYTVLRHHTPGGMGRSDLALENLALRQQLAVLQRRARRPALRPWDRAFWVLLRRFWPRWKSACILVTPATVVAWHRAGFRAFWRWSPAVNPDGVPSEPSSRR